MGLASVELILDCEETFGITISDGSASEIRTPADLFHEIQRAVHSTDQRRACISQISFHRIRSALRKATDIPRSQISLHSKIRKLFPPATRNHSWRSFQRHLAPLQLRHPDQSFFWNPPRTISDLVTLEIRRRASLLTFNQDWTHLEVRQVTRVLLSYHTDKARFADTDLLVQDLGFD